MLEGVGARHASSAGARKQLSGHHTVLLLPKHSRPSVLQRLRQPSATARHQLAPIPAATAAGPVDSIQNAASTSGRPIVPEGPAQRSRSRSATPLRQLRPPTSPGQLLQDVPLAMAAAARSATAVLLAAAVSLTATLGLPDAAAAAALLPLPTALITVPAEALALAPAPLAEPATLTASPPPPSQVSLRFTSPDMLDRLPPLPTDFPPLPEFKLPRYTTAQLLNGLRVFLLRDDEVPLVRATLIIRGGQYGSPLDKVGVASVTSYVQRAGGSTAHPTPALDNRLEELAASIEIGAGPQAFSADMQCLEEDTEEVMGLMAEIVRSPVLPGDKLALYQAQLLNALDHQNDSPGAVGRRKITKLMYGPDSIYSRTPTKAGVASITPEDMRAYVATWERPDAAVLGVVGDFEPRKMLALVEKEFGGWAPAPGQPAEPPAVPRGAPPAVPAVVKAAAAAHASLTPDVARGAVSSDPSSSSSSPSLARPASASARRPVVYLVDRPGLTQANVLTAEPGISLSDPDMFSLDVLGGVFNSFGGQLFDTIRSREGLAYSVSGSWDSPPDHQGLFLAGGQTSSPGEFLKSLRQLLARAAAEPPSEDELEASKAETLNSFAFNFSSTSNQLQRILVYDLLGLPQDFLFKYFRGIEDVDRRAVAVAAAAHLHPELQAVVVVADREVAQPSLEAAGFEVLPMRLDDAA